MPADFALVALPGAYHSSVGALIDCFSLARDRVHQLFSRSEDVNMETRLHILSLDGMPVPLSDGTILPVDGAIGSHDTFAFIWLPSFRAVGYEQMEDRLAAASPLLRWIRDQANKDTILGASGAASLLLIASGLTADIKVPVSRAAKPLIQTLFPRQPVEERATFVDHERLLITSGFAGDLRLILRVMERTLSPEIARWLTSIIALDKEDEARLAADQMVARAQLWIEQHFTESLSIAGLARHLSTSPATLNRRFHAALGLSPKAYVVLMRFHAATRLLEKSTRSIDTIAHLVGYSDSRLFRTMFRQQAGVTASEWRAAYQEKRRDPPRRGR